MEAIGRVYYPIALLLPGHDPGAGVGLAQLPGSGTFVALGHFGLTTRPQGRGEVTWADMLPSRGRAERL